MIGEEELQTVLCEIEADLNDRPLTATSDSVDDHQPLTPSQLMLGYRLDSTPVATLDPEEEADPTVFNTELLTRRQKNVQKILNRFQSRFRKEYLPLLRHTSTDSRDIDVPKVGDIVQVHDEGPRLMWNLGRIIELHKGRDGHVRSVKLKTSGGIVSRPVTRLYPLEVQATERTDREQLTTVTNPESADPPVTFLDAVGNPTSAKEDKKSAAVSRSSTSRPSRTAAIEARKRIITQLQ
jgi:hypothetical protein